MVDGGGIGWIGAIATLVLGCGDSRGSVTAIDAGDSADVPGGEVAGPDVAAADILADTVEPTPDPDVGEPLDVALDLSEPPDPGTPGELPADIQPVDVQVPTDAPDTVGAPDLPALPVPTTDGLVRGVDP